MWKLVLKRVLKVVRISLTGLLVLSLIYVAAAFKESNITGPPTFSVENMRSALPLFAIGVVIIIGGFFIPWEKAHADDRESQEVNDQKDASGGGGRTRGHRHRAANNDLRVAWWRCRERLGLSSRSVTRHPQVHLPMNVQLKSWPPSAFVVTAGLALSFAVATCLVYMDTRYAYRSVGFNDGQIHQQQQLIKTITRSVRVQNCDAYLDEKRIRFLSVKAESLYAMPAADGSMQFCRLADESASVPRVAQRNLTPRDVRD